MSTANWLEQTKASLFTLMQATTAPILVHGNQQKGIYSIVNQYFEEQLCESTSNKKPCLQCSGCQMYLAGNHPDLRYLMPQTVSIELGFSLDIKSTDKPSQHIRIEEVRDLRSYFNIASSRGAWRYVLVYPFDQMNTSAANAMLKILEEPPQGLRFVLVGHSIEKLLPTIRSRCQALPVPMPSIAECIRWLEGQGVEKPNEVLGLASNDPFEALSLWKNAPDQLEQRKKLLEWLVTNPKLQVAPPAGLEKLGLSVFLTLAMRLCSDCVAISNDLENTNFPWLKPQLKWVKHVNIVCLSQVYQKLQREFCLANHPINPRLALEYLGQQWQTLLG